MSEKEEQIESSEDQALVGRLRQELKTMQQHLADVRRANTLLVQGNDRLSKEIDRLQGILRVNGLGA